MWLAKWMQSIECGGEDALYVLFLHLLNDKPSFLSSVRAWWSSELDFGPSEDVSVSSGSSSILILMGLWLCYHTCFEDSLIELLEVCPFGVDLFSVIPILGFSSSHNSPSKPHFSFLLGKGHFGSRGESFGTFQMRSHVGTSFQLTKTHFWRFKIHDAAVNAADGSPSPTFYGEITIQRS